ncbi:uncharacterized protein BDZ83DRAFT_449732 [Colletotrichum acutatum]|uniref:Uncharacterized protein n=1 Tax=Glomerella acutata TaxID=27357 RepID=A0AAD8XM29_GLOAC|nr:uncharacterized protein BDZ83DRAFT_449732 [Colletotrichum acutatum]KAK1729932.1 hypothetical protein BDZ83DRAFT_449732 [Colletotrichum acutatum]
MLSDIFCSPLNLNATQESQSSVIPHMPKMPNQNHSKLSQFPATLSTKEQGETNQGSHSHTAQNNSGDFNCQAANPIARLSPCVCRSPPPSPLSKSRKTHEKKKKTLVHRILLKSAIEFCKIPSCHARPTFPVLPKSHHSCTLTSARSTFYRPTDQPVTRKKLHGSPHAIRCLHRSCISVFTRDHLFSPDSSSESSALVREDGFRQQVFRGMGLTCVKWHNMIAPDGIQQWKHPYTVS